MTETKVKRSLVKTFLNTGTPSSPVWVLIGDGVKSAKVDYKPKVTDETYISDDSATISVDSYAPTMPVPMTAKVGNAAFAYIDTLRKGRSVLGDAETEIVNVWLYQTPGYTWYPAEKQTVSIQVDDFGGDGGAAAALSFTLNYIGDPVLGAFKPTATATFQPNPVLAGLTALSIGGHALTPVFDRDHFWYTLAVSSSSDTITVTPDAGGATAVITNGVTVVASGGTATWVLGVNVVTVVVTKGSEVVTYTIHVTATFAT
jgi:hypothetical protein